MQQQLDNALSGPPSEQQPEDRVIQPAATPAPAQVETSDARRATLEQRMINRNEYNDMIVSDSYTMRDPSMAHGVRDRWLPPYDWRPFDENDRRYFPSFFTHPRFGRQHGPTVHHGPMDPPFIPEAVLENDGREQEELVQPRRTHNLYVQQEVNDVHNMSIWRPQTEDEMPHTGYGPEPPPESDLQHRSTPNTHLQVSPHHRHIWDGLRGIQSIQRHNMKLFEERRNHRKGWGKNNGKGKGRGRGKGHFSGPPTPNQSQDFIHFLGTQNTCSLCLDDYAQNDMVYRLTCNHVFHETCWNDYQNSTRPWENKAECPNCKGPGLVKSLYHYVGLPSQEEAEQSRNRAIPPPRNTATSSNTPPAHEPSVASTPLIQRLDEQALLITEDGTTIDCPDDPDNRATYQDYNDWMNSGSNTTLYDFMDSRNRQRTTATHLTTDNDTDDDNEHVETICSTLMKRQSRTKLPNGHSILVDIGSRINIIGTNTAQALSMTAAQHNKNTKFEKLQHPLMVNGVGKGSTPCYEQATIPIAVQYEDQPATATEYHTNVAEAPGENLPAILGLQSMQDKDTVLILRRGKEVLAMPGPGGYKIEWSPGTKLLPITAAPSGHFVIPCDKYDKVPNNHRTNNDTTTFVTD